MGESSRKDRKELRGGALVWEGQGRPGRASAGSDLKLSRESWGRSRGTGRGAVKEGQGHVTLLLLKKTKQVHWRDVRIPGSRAGELA